MRNSNDISHMRRGTAATMTLAIGLALASCSDNANSAPMDEEIQIESNSAKQDTAPPNGLIALASGGYRPRQVSCEQTSDSPTIWWSGSYFLIPDFGPVTPLQLDHDLLAISLPVTETIEGAEPNPSTSSTKLEEMHVHLVGEDEFYLQDDAGNLIIEFRHCPNLEVPPDL